MLQCLQLKATIHTVHINPSLPHDKAVKSHHDNCMSVTVKPSHSLHGFAMSHGGMIRKDTVSSEETAKHSKLLTTCARPLQTIKCHYCHFMIQKLFTKTATNKPPILVSIMSNMPSAPFQLPPRPPPSPPLQKNRHVILCLC